MRLLKDVDQSGFSHQSRLNITEALHVKKHLLQTVSFHPQDDLQFALFGTTARGEARGPEDPDPSDLDIAIVHEGEGGESFWKEFSNDVRDLRLQGIHIVTRTLREVENHEDDVSTDIARDGLIF